jgi:diguanylate cyclase (GGDEF)-like protein
MMSTQDSIALVLIAAIFANLLLAIGLIVGPRIRVRRDGGVALVQRSLDASTTTIPRAPGTGRPTPIGSGPSIVPDLEAAVLRRRLGVEETAASAPPQADPDGPRRTDAVSGFALVPSWSTWLAEEGARIERYGRRSTIVLVELPGIDRVAERLGQEAADRLIPPIATTLRREARAADCLARLGPARFGALLTETDEVQAINYVERVRAACDVWLESGAVALRLAIGWAEIAGNQPPDVAVAAAERRLNEERQRLRTRAEALAPTDGEAGVDGDAMEAVGA